MMLTIHEVCPQCDHIVLVGAQLKGMSGAGVHQALAYDDARLLINTACRQLELHMRERHPATSEDPTCRGGEHVWRAPFTAEKRCDCGGELMPGAVAASISANLRCESYRAPSFVVKPLP